MSESSSRLLGLLTSEHVEPSRVMLYVVGTLLAAVVVHWTIQIAGLIRKRRRDGEALREFDGPPGHWFFGNLRDVIGLEDRITYSQRLIPEYPKIVKTRMTPFNYNLRVYHPDTIKLITNTNEPKDPFGYRFLLPWIGDGLLVSKGQKWSRNRRLLTPAFNFDILKPYVTVFSQSSLTLVNKLKGILEKKDQSIELFEHISLMTFDALMKCIFGFQGNCQVEGFKHPYIQGVYEVVQLVVRRFIFFPYHSDLIYRMSWSGYKFRRACAMIHTYSRNVIADKRLEKSRNEGVKQKKAYVDFMDILVEAKDEDGRGLTDEEIQAEVDTFMFEGHDTTASGISWCLYNLAKHPEYQAKCREEVNSVLGDRQHFEWDDVHKLPFLTMCVKESLRLHPPVPMVARETTKPHTFPDGRQIPAGILIIISIFGCHHHPDVWENPEVYDPYRFTPENCKGRSPHAFVPFSAGPRNCIGQHFALHEMKVAVGQVLRHFELVEDINNVPKRDAMLILRAKDGIHIKMKAIDV